MSASAIRRKSYKKAQEEAGPFSPVHWEGDDGGGNEVPAGKLQVMEKFFTPVQQAPEGKGGSDPALWGCRQPWTESRSDRFSTLSSSSTTSASSASSASWSSGTSLDKAAFLPAGPPYHSQSCVDVSGEARVFRRGRDEEAAYTGEEPAGSFARLRKGQSKSADGLPPRQGHHEAPPMPGPAGGVDRHLYNATSLERSLVFNEHAEIIPTKRHPHQAGVPGPSKGILKNGALATADRLRKAKSIETITVRQTGRESLPAPGPPRPLQREKQPPNSLDLSAPKKSPVTERMKLVEEKLRFSEFLNEITRQVLSPSSLSSLGWKPPEAASASRAPSSDGSEPKGGGGGGGGGSSKASSPGSFLETADGKVEEKASRGRRRLGQPEAPPSHHNQRPANPVPARTMEEASPELSPLPSANMGSLPKQVAEAARGQRKPGESGAGPGREAEGQGQPPKKAEQDAVQAAEQPSAQERQELLVEPSTEQLASAQEPEQQTFPARRAEAESASETGQRDLQKTWEELDVLKEKFSRLQEDYSNTRHANQLLEEKLQIIAQSMTEERQALNHQITELLERLVGAQNTICTLEKLNISGLLSRSSRKHLKAESPDSLSSLHILDVAPPPAFMDGASDARTTPSQSDSATEASKLGCSSESDTAVPNGEQSPLLEYGPPRPEGGPKRHDKSHSRATAFTPWKQKSTKFSVDMNSTESECSGEETVPVCPLPPPRFLYLRQEALAIPAGPGAFPPLPASAPAAVQPPSPSSLPAGGRLELVPEMSSSESSEDGELSWSPGLVERTSGSRLDYQSAQKMLDSLLHKSPGQEKSREKEPRKAGRPGGYRVAAGPERLVGHQQHRIRYYQDFPGPGEEAPEAQSYPGSQHGRGSLPRGSKGAAAVGLEGSDAAQDSTSL